MTGRLDPATWAAALRAPLDVPQRLIYRPWSGGDLTRRFRGTPSDGNDHWTEEWLGSDMEAGNPRPDGGVQGMTAVRAPDGSEALIRDLAAAFPLELLGADHVERFGVRLGFLLKMVSLSAPAPVHCHPDAAFAKRHLGHDSGQSETWMILETRTADDGGLPIGVGFREGVTRADIMAAVERRSTSDLQDLVERATVVPGDVVYVRSGLPHFIGSEVLFIEVQHPSDFTILTEFWTLGVPEADAALGLGWDTALDAFALDAEEDRGPRAIERARQRPATVETQGRSEVVGLIEPFPQQPFDMRRLDVRDTLMVADGRFSVQLVTQGYGAIEGEWGTTLLQRGDIFATAAALPHRYVAGDAPMQVHRCLGPAVG